MDYWFERLTDTLKNEQLKLLVQYGSTTHKTHNTQDNDIFAVCETDKEKRVIKFGLIDLKLVNSIEFDYYYSNLDPIFCTEPIITGNIVYGNYE